MEMAFHLHIAGAPCAACLQLFLTWSGVAVICLFHVCEVGLSSPRRMSTLQRESHAVQFAESVLPSAAAFVLLLQLMWQV